MKAFAKALGARCSDCHIEADFEAPTPRKAIARGMWDHFVRELQTKDGSAVCCDSCHQGSLTPLLDRHDKKALSRWMDENYVAQLKRRDGKEHDCPRCHGDPFQPRFLKTWAIPPTAPGSK